MTLDISNPAYNGVNLDSSGQTTFAISSRVADGGTRVYVWDYVSAGDGVVYQYSLSTPNDLDSASYDGISFNFPGDYSPFVQFEFKPDGTKVYTFDQDNEEVEQFDLSTAWDISTASFVRNMALAPVTGAGRGIRFKPDGTQMYLGVLTGGGSGTGAIQQYSLSTPWDISTATLDSTTTITSPFTTVRHWDFAISAAGDKAVAINNNLEMYQYDLSTPWDSTTIAYDSVTIDIGAIIGNLDSSSVDVSADDTWLFVFRYDGGAPAQELHQMKVGLEQLSTRLDLEFEQQASVAKAHTASIPLRLARAHVARIPLRVAAAHSARWNLRLARAHTARIPLRVGAAHTAPIAFGVRRAHTAPITLLAPVRQANAAVFDLRAGDPVRAAHTARIPLRVGAAHTAVAPLMAFVRRAHAAVWDLRVDVRAAHTAAVPLLDHDPVRRAHAAVFSLLGEPRTHMTMNVSATTGGRAIPVLSWDIRADEGGYLYEGEIDTDANGYGLVNVGDALTLDLFGEAYALVIESRRRDKRGPAGRRFVLGVRSPTVRFDFPRADPVTRTFDASVMARAAVEALLGEAVSWELVNWPIPAFRLAFEQASPIAAAQQIVEAAGGTMQTDPDGTLRVRHLYPVSPKNLYQDATAARVIDDQDDVTASSESFEPRRLVDRLSLRDTVEGVFSDRLEFAADADNDRAGTVHVYPSPWRTNVVVTHTSNASLQLTQLGETTREETEVVEFTAGTARLRYPIDALLAVSWLYDSLGGVSFEPYATELAAGGEAGYSLAEITYRTRSIDYRLVSPTVDQAQLLLQEVP